MLRKIDDDLDHKASTMQWSKELAANLAGSYEAGASDALRYVATSVRVDEVELVQFWSVTMPLDYDMTLFHNHRPFESIHTIQSPCDQLAVHTGGHGAAQRPDK